jgi:hypothetical protein
MVAECGVSPGVVDPQLAVDFDIEVIVTKDEWVGQGHGN